VFFQYESLIGLQDGQEGLTKIGIVQGSLPGAIDDREGLGVIGDSGGQWIDDLGLETALAHGMV